VLLRLVYLGVTNVFALLRLLPVSDRDKDAEILMLRHQIMILERQLGTTRPRFRPGDRMFLAALLHRLSRDVLGRFRLRVRPDTVLRWHRDVLARRQPRIRLGLVMQCGELCRGECLWYTDVTAVQQFTRLGMRVRANACGQARPVLGP
jgi:hypothetical protein